MPWPASRMSAAAASCRWPAVAAFCTSYAVNSSWPGCQKDVQLACTMGGRRWFCPPVFSAGYRSGLLTSPTACCTAARNRSFGTAGGPECLPYHDALNARAGTSIQNAKPTPPIHAPLHSSCAPCAQPWPCMGSPRPTISARVSNPGNPQETSPGNFFKFPVLETMVSASWKLETQVTGWKPQAETRVSGQAVSAGGNRETRQGNWAGNREAGISRRQETGRTQTSCTATHMLGRCTRRVPTGDCKPVAVGWDDGLMWPAGSTVQYASCPLS